MHLVGRIMNMLRACEMCLNTCLYEELLLTFLYACLHSEISLLVSYGITLMQVQEGNLYEKSHKWKP